MKCVMTMSKLTQSQCEAAVDVLVLAMCVDGHFSLLEEDKIQEKIAGLGWDPDSTPDHHVNLAIARARDAAESPEKIQAYLEKRAEVLESPEIKAIAYDKAVELLNSDGVKAEENAFISQIRTVFKL